MELAIITDSLHEFFCRVIVVRLNESMTAIASWPLKAVHSHIIIMYVPHTVTGPWSLYVD